MGWPSFSMKPNKNTPKNTAPLYLNIHGTLGCPPCPVTLTTRTTYLTFLGHRGSRTDELNPFRVALENCSRQGLKNKKTGSKASYKTIYMLSLLWLNFRGARCTYIYIYGHLYIYVIIVSGQAVKLWVS